MPLRVAILSTPRSGNTWLRHLLGAVYAVPSIAVNIPTDVDWPGLPQECVLQLHWHRYPAFLARLEQCRFRVLVLARHPLDVLISILHYSMHEPTGRWLEGEDGNECTIFGAMPRSTAFLDYASGKRAAALLSVSREWWDIPACVQVYYETLVRDPQAEVGRLQDLLGVAARKPIAEAVAETTLSKLRVLTTNQAHFWQGKPGLWRSLLTAAEANRIAGAHQTILAELGYACEPDADLTGSEADANWIRLAWHGLVDDLQNVRIVQREHTLLQNKFAAAEAELQAAKAQIEGCQQELRQLEALREQYEQQCHELAQRQETKGWLQGVASRFFSRSRVVENEVDAHQATNAPQAGPRPERPAGASHSA